MYRNSEHYADPTAGRALAHLIAADQRRRGKNSHASKPVPLKRTPAKMKCQRKQPAKRKEHVNYQYVHVWDAPEITAIKRHAV